MGALQVCDGALSGSLSAINAKSVHWGSGSVTGRLFSSSFGRLPGWFSPDRAGLSSTVPVSGVEESITGSKTGKLAVDDVGGVGPTVMPSMAGGILVPTTGEEGAHSWLFGAAICSVIKCALAPVGEH